MWDRNCAGEHRRAGRREKEVVHDQRALARYRREEAALLQKRRAPGEERKRSPDEDDEDRQNEHAARRIARAAPTVQVGSRSVGSAQVRPSWSSVMSAQQSAELGPQTSLLK